jgi:hypothetical protein
MGGKKAEATLAPQPWWRLRFSDEAQSVGYAQGRSEEGRRSCSRRTWMPEKEAPGGERPLPRRSSTASNFRKWAGTVEKIPACGCAEALFHCSLAAGAGPMIGERQADRPELFYGFSLEGLTYDHSRDLYIPREATSFGVIGKTGSRQGEAASRRPLQTPPAEDRLRELRPQATMPTKRCRPQAAALDT